MKMDLPKSHGNFSEFKTCFQYNQCQGADDLKLMFQSYNPSKPVFFYEDISEDESSSTDSGIVCSKIQTSVEEWNSDQIMKWILELYDKEGYRYEDLNLHYFKHKDGKFFINLTEQDFQKVDEKRSKWLYTNVQQLTRKTFTWHDNNESSSRASVISYTSNSQSSGYNSGTQSSDDDEPIPYTRKRGRPRLPISKRRNTQKLGRIWEFLRDLLLDPLYCPRIICWEDYDTKVFRLIDGNEVARIWGKKKNNPTMDYGKFSRSIRHYYKLKVIESVDKRYAYKFGENADGCETDNPNFGVTVNL